MRKSGLFLFLGCILSSQAKLNNQNVNPMNYSESRASQSKKPVVVIFKKLKDTADKM
jgi:hypothetical protein